MLKCEFSVNSINMTVSVILQLILLLGICHGDTAKHLDNTLTAIEKLVDYYEQNFPTLNLDGIYGLRVLEGQIALILESYAAGQIHNPTPDWAWRRLVKVRDVSHNISELATKSLQETEPDYYKQMQWIVDRPMKFARDYRRLDPSFTWPTHVKKNGEPMKEKFSDQCMHELMGNEENGYQKCAVSNKCLSQMLQRGNIEYTITHQLLYTVVAEQNGCVDELEQYLHSQQIADSVSIFQLDLCTNNFFEIREMLDTMRPGVIESLYHDLFMEQLFVCPVLGFMEFLHADWLYRVLSWQQAPGCYGKAEGTGNGRKLLFEKDLHDGCLSHRTAVAAACLSQFLRFLVNPGSPDYQLYTRIDGPNHLLAKPVLIGQVREENEEDGEEDGRDQLHDGQLQAARAQLDLVEAEERAELRKKAMWDALDHQDREEDEDEERVMLGGGGRLNRLQDNDREEEDVVLQAKNPLQEGEEEERVLLRGGQLNRLQEEEDEEEDDDEEEEEDQDAPHYYSEDEDEEENKVNHLQKAAVAAAQQQLRVADDQEDDKQYIDDDNTHEQPGNDESKAQPAKSFQDPEHHNVDVKEINDDVYNDYEDSKAHKLNLKNPKLGMSTHSMMLETSEGSMATGYAIILGTMTVVLVFMYRFIRKRRVLIKYRYAR